MVDFHYLIPLMMDFMSIHLTFFGSVEFMETRKDAVEYKLLNKRELSYNFSVCVCWYQPCWHYKAII